MSTDIELPSHGKAVWGRTVGWFLAKVVWNTTVVGAHYVPADGPILLAANHTGVIDGPVLSGASPRPLHIMVKEEMFKGLMGAFLRSTGQIPVEREAGRSALAIARGVLKRGGAVGVFPEGTRGRGDASNARGGVAWLALNGGASVVPVAVLGTRRTGESVGAVPRFRRRLHVEFGPPVTVQREPGTTGKAAQESAQEVVRAALSAHVAQVSNRVGIPLPDDDM